MVKIKLQYILVKQSNHKLQKTIRNHSICILCRQMLSCGGRIWNDISEYLYDWPKKQQTNEYQISIAPFYYIFTWDTVIHLVQHNLSHQLARFQTDISVLYPLNIVLCSQMTATPISIWLMNVPYTICISWKLYKLLKPANGHRNEWMNRMKSLIIKSVNHLNSSENCSK